METPWKLAPKSAIADPSYATTPRLRAIWAQAFRIAVWFRRRRVAAWAQGRFEPRKNGQGVSCGAFKKDMNSLVIWKVRQNMSDIYLYHIYVYTYIINTTCNPA